MARVMDLRKPQAAPRPPASAAPRPPQREPKRTAPLKVRKRRRRIIVALAWIVSAAAALYGIHWVSYLPQYTIQDVEIQGTVSLTREDILGRIDGFFASKGTFISPRSIFWHDEAGIERMLESDILHIADARVSRDGFMATTLSVALDERVPFARWCATDASCYVIDKTGFIFAPYDASSTVALEPVSFTGGVSDPGNPLGHSVAAARFPAILSFIAALGQAGYPAASADIDADGNLAFALAAGFTIYVSPGADPVALIRDLRLILGSEALRDHVGELEYVDLRFGNRVFYKLKGQEAVGQ